MTAFSIQPKYISAYIVHSKGTQHYYLLLRRCSKYLTGTWQMITGSILEGEKAWEAALREVFEETGVVPTKMYSADAVDTFYMKSEDKIMFVPAFVGFFDSLEPIKLSSSEHDAYEWLSFEDALERLVWSEQKRILKHIHENFVIKNPNPINLI